MWEHLLLCKKLRIRCPDEKIFYCRAAECRSREVDFVVTSRPGPSWTSVECKAESRIDWPPLTNRDLPPACTPEGDNLTSTGGACGPPYRIHRGVLVECKLCTTKGFMSSTDGGTSVHLAPCPERPGGVAQRSPQRMTPVRIGVLGLGTVGGGTVNVLGRNAEEIARRAGRDVVVTRAAVRSLDRRAHLRHRRHCAHRRSGRRSSAIRTSTSWWSSSAAPTRPASWS